MGLDNPSSKERVGRHVGLHSEAEEGALLKQKIKAQEWRQSHPREYALAHLLINQIQPQAVHQIFLEDARKSEGDVRELNFVPRDRIFLGDGNYYNSAANAIMLAPEHLGIQDLEDYNESDAMAREEKREKTVQELCRFIGTVMHENAHAHGFVQMSEREEFLPDERYRQEFESRAGFRQSKETTEISMLDRKSSSENSMEFWNEGFTEWYAMRVGREYLRRQPLQWLDIHISAQQFEDHVPEILAGSPYNYAAYLIGELINVIAEKHEVPRDVVENSIVRAYLTESGREHLLRALQKMFKTPGQNSLRSAQG